MRKLLWIVLLVWAASHFSAVAQTTAAVTTSASFTSREQFFSDEHPIDMMIATDFKNMLAQKQKGVYQSALVDLHLTDSAEIKQNIQLYARGEYRRKYCLMPGIMLNFKGAAAAQLGGMKKIKLVCACNTSVYDGQLLLT